MSDAHEPMTLVDLKIAAMKLGFNKIRRDAQNAPLVSLSTWTGVAYVVGEGADMLPRVPFTI